jgi:hypothetical protein
MSKGRKRKRSRTSVQGAGSRGENNRAVVQRVDKAHRVMFPELQDEMNRRDIATTYVNKNNLNNRQNNTYPHLCESTPTLFVGIAGTFLVEPEDSTRAFFLCFCTVMYL